MKQRSFVHSLLAALTVAACVATTAFAQGGNSLPAHPMYVTRQPHLTNVPGAPPATPLTTWNGSFAYQGRTYKYNMVGTAPSTGTSTTIPVYIIPVNLSYVTSKGTVTLSPSHKLSNGQTVGANILASPMFKKGIDFTSGGTDMGTTQYIDAFQRGNFWGQVSSATGYHLLLGSPKILPPLKLTVPSADGGLGNQLGIQVGTADINWIDAKFQNYISTHTQIVPNSLPIFVTYETYLTQFGGCCIGGYHSAMGSTAAPQAYAHFTYISVPGSFAQDVSALSHEVGEWADDPLVVNTSGNSVQCGILEVGDPEEGYSNYGGFPYTLGGFTYNLQDLTYLEYFGAPTSTSVGGLMTFQNNPFGMSICQNGG